MKKNILRYLILIFSFSICGCHNVDQGPKETADAFLKSWFEIDFEEMTPRYEAFISYLDNEVPDKASDIGDEPLQKMKEFHSDLLSFLTDDAYESAVNMSYFTYPLEKSMTLKANSKITNMTYEQLFNEEDSVGYGVTVDFELSPINGENTIPASDYLTLTLKKIDNVWKVTAVTAKKIKPL